MGFPSREIRENLGDIVTPPSHEAFRAAAQVLPAEFLTGSFAQLAAGAVTAVDVERLMLSLPALKENMATGEILISAGSIGDGVMKRGDQLASHKKELLERANGKGKDSMADLLAMLQDRIDDINLRLGEIREQIGQVEDRLKEQYGENWLEVMAETHLSEEDLQDLEGLSGDDREKAIREKLMDRILDENGNPKSGYDGLDIAEASKLWRQEQVQEQKLENLQDGYKEALEKGDPQIAIQVIEENNQAGWAVRQTHSKDLASVFAEARDNNNAVTLAAAVSLEQKDAQEFATADNSEANRLLNSFL